MRVLEGLIVVKFWTPIRDAEQLKRVRGRQKDPLKR